MADSLAAEKLQPLVVKQLETVLRNDELVHAYMLVGPSGSGKSEIARWLALRLFCLRPQDGEPDLTCSECQRILSGNHPDVVVAKAEGRQIKVDEIRRLKDEFTKSAMEGNQKLFVIHDAEKLTGNAANSLLKFIEEPGKGIYILLLTSNKSAVLPTIRSRTQVIELQPLQRDSLVQELKQAGVSQKEIMVSLGITNSIDEIMEWREENWLLQAIEGISLWYKHISQANMLGFVDVQSDLLKLAESRKKQQVMLDLMALIWRDTLLKANGLADEGIHFVPAKQQIGDVAKQYSVNQLLQVSQITLTSRRLLDQNISFQNVVEQLTIRIAQVLSGK